MFALYLLNVTFEMVGCSNHKPFFESVHAKCAKTIDFYCAGWIVGDLHPLGLA